MPIATPKYPAGAAASDPSAGFLRGRAVQLLRAAEAGALVPTVPSAQIQAARAAAPATDPAAPHRPSPGERRIMRKAVIAASLLCALAAAASPAQAQRLTGPELDRLSRDRGPTNREEITPLPAAPVAPGTFVPAQDSWECKSITEWTDVLAEAQRGARVIGKTQMQVAVSTRAAVNGFREILFYNGTRGFVPASQVKPYSSTINPGQGCTVSLEASTGKPKFSYPQPSSAPAPR